MKWIVFIKYLSKFENKFFIVKYFLFLDNKKKIKKKSLYFFLIKSNNLSIDDQPDLIEVLFFINMKNFILDNFINFSRGIYFQQIWICLTKKLFLYIFREMVREFNNRVQNWNFSSCIADVMYKFTRKSDIVINYANNNDSIITTLDKLISTNPQFREFLVPIDNTNLTNMLRYVY